MRAKPQDPPLHDFNPPLENTLEDVIDGFREPQKYIPSRLLYDEQGSRLFEEICKLDEYYPTRTELAIMRSFAREMATAIGPECLLIEYGSGSGIKTRLLLDALERPAAYVPIDISRSALAESARELQRSYPALQILPVCADYLGEYALPESDDEPARRVAYFPGSTVGNFCPDEARVFLDHVAEICGAGGGLLVGIDLDKDPHVLELAYDDPAGVTAEFELNVLRRLNRELDADFDVDAFDYVARYNASYSRIEMYLVSAIDQRVRIGGHEFELGEGEEIRTEYAHKFTVDGFAELASGSGLALEQSWTDPQDLFCVQYLRVLE